MIYEIDMLCKHFKGKTLEDKNIYRIIQLGVSGKDVDTNEVTYTGDGELQSAENLVVYANIFQNNKLFAREYEDISGELSAEKQEMFGQLLKVQPLTQSEITRVESKEFIAEKTLRTQEKYR